MDALNGNFFGRGLFNNCLTNNIGAIKLYEKCGLRRIFEDKNYYETLETKSAYYYES